MNTKSILWMGKDMVLACDGKCDKAWGFNTRPKNQMSEDQDDVVYLADGELDKAPKDPGTYEGGHGKPKSPDEMNKWCARECERSDMASSLDRIHLADWSQRLFNQPWKHGITTHRKD